MNKLKLILRIYLAINCLLIGAIIITYYSFNDYKIYHTPRAINGIMDFENCNDYDKNINVQIVGEVEFYYNKWIVSDNDINKMDSYINAPSKWSNIMSNDSVYKKKDMAHTK